MIKIKQQKNAGDQKLCWWLEVNTKIIVTAQFQYSIQPFPSHALSSNVPFYFKVSHYFAEMAEDINEEIMENFEMTEVLVRRCSSKKIFWKILQIQSKTPMLESQAYNFTKKRLQHRCFLVKFAIFSRTHFLQDTSGGCFYKML